MIADKFGVKMNYLQIGKAGVEDLCVNQSINQNPALAFFMDIEEAIRRLFESARFKDAAKEKDALGSKLRSYKSRYEAGKLGITSKINLLLDFGYKIKIEKP